MYTDSTSRSAGTHVASSSQSNGGSPEREPTRTGMPRASSRSTTRRPVLPVPPRTSVTFFSCELSASIIFSFDAVCFTLLRNITPGRVEGHPPKGGLGGWRSSCTDLPSPTRARLPPRATDHTNTGGFFETPAVRLEQYRLPSLREGLRAVAHVELAVDVLDVGLDRAQRNEQLSGNLPV